MKQYKQFRREANYLMDTDRCWMGFHTETNRAYNV